MFISRAALFLSLNLVFLYSFTLVKAQSKAEAIEKIFSKYHAFENFQGVVLVAESGEVIYRKAFGLANREWGIPNQIDTRFNIASVSKQFTAMLVMQLIEEGKIHLDSTMSAYYPEYRQDIGRKVTIHHLLSHSSGIPNYTSLPYVWSDSLQLRYTKQELVRKFCSHDLEFKPGSRYQYNNTGYFLLSMIVEKVTGKDYEAVLEERILQPVGLKNTAVDSRDKIIPRRAYGYEKEGEEFINAADIYMQNLQGVGNLYSTVDDLFAWDRALCSDKIMSRKSIDLMQTAYTEKSSTWISPYLNSYGYGVGIADISLNKKKSTRMIFHSGHIRGFSCYFARFPEDRHTIIMLSNTGNVSTARMNEITQQVKNVLYDLPYEMPERSLVSELLQVIESRGAEAAIRHFYQLKDSFPYEFKNVRGDLNELGTALSNDNKPIEALEIFKLNAKLYPDWASYQRLAFAYLQNGDAQEAGRYYKKSITLNPGRSATEKRGYKEAMQALKDLSN